MVPNTNDNGPPPGFLEAQERARKYKKGRRPKPSASASNAPLPDDGFQDQATEATPDLTASTTVPSQAEGLRAPNVGKPGPSNVANAEEIAPQQRNAAEATPDPTVSTDTDAAVHDGISDLDDDGTQGGDDSTHGGDDSTHSGDDQREMTPRPPMEAGHRPRPKPRPAGAGFTQHNAQHNHNTQQNTYNYTYNHTSYGGGQAPPFDGRGWRVPCLSYGVCPLILIILLVSLAALAVYGAATVWNNSVVYTQNLFSSVASVLTFGYFAPRPDTRPAGDSPPITFVTTAYPTAETTVSGHMIPAPSGIVNAIDDVGFWIAHLEHPDTVAEMQSHGLYFSGFQSIGLDNMGRLRDAWVIVSEDILVMEGKVKEVFGSLDRDMSQLLRDLASHPASVRWRQQANASFWEWLLSVMPWCSRKTPADILRTNYERLRSLSSGARAGGDLFPKPETDSIYNRLVILREGVCKLRNFVEKSAQHFSNKTEDATSGMAAIAARGNILCDIFVRTELRVKNLEILLRRLATDSEAMERTEGVSLKAQLSVAPRSALEVKVLEDKMAKWLRKIAGTVKRLHRAEFDG